MKLEINYFGQLAEAVKTSKEWIEIESNCSVEELKIYLLEQHPLLKNKSFKIAINQKVTAAETRLSENDEVALLPPFAGG